MGQMGAGAEARGNARLHDRHQPGVSSVCRRAAGRKESVAIGLQIDCYLGAVYETWRASYHHDPCQANHLDGKCVKYWQFKEASFRRVGGCRGAMIELRLRP